MITKIDVVQNDCLYALGFTLQDAEENAFDLSDVIELMIKVQHEDDNELKFEGLMDIVTPGDGVSSYIVQAADFDKAGKYYAEITATLNTGQIITWDDIEITAAPNLPR